MTELDERALAIALDDAPTPEGDAELADAVARARHDIDRIRAGLDLVADIDERPTPGPSSRRRWLSALTVAAAAVAIAGIAGVTIPRDADEPSRSAAPTTSSTDDWPGAVSMRPGPALTLDERVAQADAIVIGTITAVERGELEPDGVAMPYVLATVDVEEAILGDVADTVVAFDYDFGGGTTSSDAPALPWNVGDEVLLFLVSDAGTVSEDLEPAHLQVADGAGGRYVVVDGQIDAPFTIEEVRAAAG